MKNKNLKKDISRNAHRFVGTGPSGSMGRAPAPTPAPAPAPRVSTPSPSSGSSGGGSSSSTRVSTPSVQSSITKAPSQTQTGWGIYGRPPGASSGDGNFTGNSSSQMNNAQLANYLTAQGGIPSPAQMASRGVTHSRAVWRRTANCIQSF